MATKNNEELDESMFADIPSGDSLENDSIVSQETIERDYTKIKAEIEGEVDYEVPEMEQNNMRINFNEEEIEGTEEDGGEEEEQESEEPKRKRNSKNVDPIFGRERDEGEEDFRNPAYDTMTPKQKKESSSNLADMAIRAYEKLCSLGKSYAQFDDAKMQKKAMRGEFDMSVLSVHIPIDETGQETVSVKEFLDELNDNAEDIFTVSDDFKDEVYPLLCDIFSKNGWGMTPEQKLLSLVAEDVTPKVAGIVAIRKSIKDLTDIASSMVEEIKKQGYNPPPPPPKQEPKQEHKESGSRRHENPDFSENIYEDNSEDRCYSYDEDVERRETKEPKRSASKKKGRPKKEDVKEDDILDGKDIIIEKPKTKRKGRPSRKEVMESEIEDVEEMKEPDE